MHGEYTPETRECVVLLDDRDDPTNQILLKSVLAFARRINAGASIHIFQEVNGVIERKYYVVLSDRPNDMERLLAEMEPLPVLNVKQCSWCQGPVDRHAHCFQCRECKSMGDLVTGIMSQPYELIVTRKVMES